MNKRGLCLVLVAGVLLGLLFGVFPELDLWISGIFFDRSSRVFILARESAWVFVRNANMVLFAVLLAGLCTYFAVKALRSATAAKRDSAIRAFCLLALTAAIGPGLLVNMVLKDNWSRARPGMIPEFNTEAQGRFTPWWRTDGSCDSNCSFVAGEASIAFWLLAPATLIASQRRRRFAYAAMLGIGGLAGLQRVSVGGHFSSDVIFAGVVVFVVVWLIHWLIYRFPLTSGLFARAAGVTSSQRPQDAATGATALTSAEP